ncbi:hypothetical protein GCM10007907_27900 [Chitinimonas prasina]|uniref:Uncharacterized protein n=1 Tax=Chitinimonas prasina TaxID=1434937 RepID=A0ABQ5YG76_9NEIS|nr:hypothetical protein [Chitinimonas prasina]GLR14000.1 hypothetical protein GCM10007907_27900 [Chitinimonas prasina]
MSEASQFMGGSGAQIGDIRAFPERGIKWGPHPETAEIWLRTGTLALASMYPRAAAMPELQAFGTAAVTLPMGANVVGVATDNVLTAVACFSHATHVLVTTNGGMSWQLVPHNLAGGVVAVDVAWTGSRFVVVGNSSTHIYCSYSANGLAFTAGASIAPGATLSPANVRVRSDGTNCLVVAGYVSGTAGAQAAVTADGTAMAVRNLAGSYNSPLLAVLPSLGAARWLVFSNTAVPASQSTAADGSTWAARTLPGNQTYAACATATHFVLGGGGVLYRSATGADGSWTVANIPGSVSGSPSYAGTVSVAYHVGLQFDGTRLLISGGRAGSNSKASMFGYSSDLQLVEFRQLAFPVDVLNAGPLAIAIGPNLAFLPTGAVATWAGYAANWLSGGEYVGINVDMPLNGGLGPSGGSNNLCGVTAYVRVA